ncbi:hypothetical protein LINGRAHAP2_LOCUS35552 [Linum grandiflorum]
MIKISSKPISSPGRAEKYYPPPLMRFLRSNVASKSRGRSRSSPMFVRKKNTSAAAAIEAPEPSSPKVTCMGQVRVRRSAHKNKKKKKRRTSDCNRCCRCKWIQTVLFCHGCCSCRRPRRCKPPPPPACCFVRPDWRKLTRFFRCKRKPKINEDKETDFGSSLGRRREEEEDDDYSGDEELDVEEEEQTTSSSATRKVFACSSPINSPPKNALLLIRSRSAPYRTSSLASRFWGSPVGSEETEQKQSTEQEEEDSTSLTSKRESSSSSGEESDKESRMDPETEEIKLGLSKSDFEGSDELIKGRIEDAEEVVDESETEAVVERRPVMLTRCKSEPARIGGEKFDVEVSFWKKRRLGFT